jgi:muramoyltetrapeptide carboxypeptidase
MNKIPPYLSKGSTVGIVSTARKIDSEVIKMVVNMLKSEGFSVKLASNIENEDNQYCGTDDERTKAFQELLDDDSVEAILCARGGYGTVRIIDNINFSEFTKKPKWIAGFSDVTVIHSHLNTLHRVSSLHSTMPISMARPDNTSQLESNSQLYQALKGASLHFTFQSSRILNSASFEGEIVGGNLSILYSLLASKSDLDTTGKILFIEDLDEYLYHIDRMMMALKRSGKLDGLKGLIIGTMADMNDNDVPFGKDAFEIITEHASQFDFPVVFNFPAGHSALNYPIRMGMKATVSINGETVEFTQSA